MTFPTVIIMVIHTSQKLVLTVGVLLLLSLNCNADELELVTLSYPPYEYEENGNIKGIAVDIVREVFKRMDQPIRIKLLPWARALRNVKIGKSDAVFTAYRTPEREKFANYSKQVLMPQIVSFFVKRGSSIKFQGDLNQLRQYSIGVVSEVSYGEKFDIAIENNLLTNIEETSTGELNMKMLLKGRFDILVSNKFGALFILKNMNKKHEVKELHPPINQVPSYIAFTKMKQTETIRDEFDITLKALKDEGTFEKIISNFFQ